MAPNDDQFLRNTWQAELNTTRSLDPVELRARADASASRARRSVRINRISAGAVAVIAAAGLVIVDGGLLPKVGTAMLLIAALYMIWAFKHFFAVLSIPADANAATCTEVHKRQLERQRDMNLSARSAGPLLLPSLILFALAKHWPDADTFVGPEGWGFTIVFIASAYFVFQLMCAYADLLASRFQREIDELESMMGCKD